MNKLQIRYNTASINETDKWRLIENGKQHLVSKIIIDDKISTSKDWVEEINDFKWHISSYGNFKIDNGVAYITTSIEKSVFIRHILKTISYRLLGTLTTITIAYFLGASLEVSSLLGVVELCVKPLIYFLHERVWYKMIRLDATIEK